MPSPIFARFVLHFLLREDVTRDAKIQLRALKAVLGARRYRIAMLRDGRGKTSKQIAKRLRITRQAVERHFEAIDGHYASLRRERDALESGDAFAGFVAAYRLN